MGYKLENVVEQERVAEEDSLRVYPLDENARSRIEHIGRFQPLDFEGPLIF